MCLGHSRQLEEEFNYFMRKKDQMMIETKLKVRCLSLSLSLGGDRRAP